MSSWNIAVVGATGLVGRAIIELLQERNFPLSQLFLLASDNSVDETILFNNKNIPVNSLVDFDWTLANFAFFVAGPTVTTRYADIAAESGCIVIDNSGVFASNLEIPLIVPYVNNSVLSDYRNCNIVSVANAVISQLLRSVSSMAEKQDIQKIHMTSFIPASFYGKAGIDELAGQSARLLNGMAIDNTVFAKQLAFNLYPVTEKNNTHSSGLNEADLVEQCRRVLGDYQFPVSIDLINAPVFYGLAQTVGFTLSYPIVYENIQQMLSSDKRVMLFNESDLPTPVTEFDSDLNLKIANLHYSYGIPDQLQFWSVTDNVRYLGALMAIETIELLIQDYL